MEGQRLTLVEPALEMEAAFEEFAADLHSHGEDHHIREPGNRRFADHVRRLQTMARGEGLAPGLVPMTVFWLADENGTILGESRLRHVLTPFLEAEGGHIGYVIRPSARRRGYGEAILKLTLEEAKKIGLRRVLVTCDEDNEASARIIESNGGVRAEDSVSPRTSKRIRRYWIGVE